VAPYLRRRRRHCRARRSSRCHAAAMQAQAVTRLAWRPDAEDWLPGRALRAWRVRRAAPTVPLSSPRVSSCFLGKGALLQAASLPAPPTPTRPDLSTPFPPLLHSLAMPYTTSRSLPPRQFLRHPIIYLL
jgi:hypothetical protein